MTIVAKIPKVLECAARDVNFVYDANNVKILEVVKASLDYLNFPSSSGRAYVFSNEIGNAINIIKLFHILSVSGEVIKGIEELRSTPNNIDTIERSSKLANIVFGLILESCIAIEWLYDRDILSLNKASLEKSKILQGVADLTLSITAVISGLQRASLHKHNSNAETLNLATDLAESLTGLVVDFKACDILLSSGNKEIMETRLKLIKALAGYCKAASRRHFPKQRENEKTGKVVENQSQAI